MALLTLSFTEILAEGAVWKVALGSGGEGDGQVMVAVSVCLTTMPEIQDVCKNGSKSTLQVQQSLSTIYAPSMIVL